MFSSALKSFSSNISSNYSIAPQPSSTSGPWKIFDAKRKSTGKAASVFVFDKKSLEAQGGALGGRGNNASIKRAQEEVVERLRKEASSLARLRHPSVLELAEPVEETRSGGLIFATEPVTASLAGLLAEKDEQERSGGVGGRGSRYVVEEADGKGRRRRELEIDELEIQKGLLQIGKGLEFLHESAGLVHGNLTPEAIFVNAKSDWKISGLGFSGLADNATNASSAAPIALSEVLNHDPRLPRFVQLNLDYTSPDFVLDRNATSSADMFSLGLLIIALYNAPHKSPIEASCSLSAYKRLFASSSSIPSQNNNFLSAGPLPKSLASDLLPRLITRRPAQRLTAREFQQAQYFDNILVSTIRFLDALPAKTPNEKMQFMRGLPRILPQFPKSVLGKKVLPALLEEMKDRDLLAPILQNIFAIVNAMPAGRRIFTEIVIPKLREVFLSGPASKAAVEDTKSKEPGLMIVIENMSVVAANCSGKEFRDDILPIINLGLGSQTHAVIDASLATLPSVLPVLDYTTIKNELFPVIANVFAHTNSLGIKIQGLEAFYTLCGGTAEAEAPVGDGLDGSVTKHEAKSTSSAVLDKFTIQEKVVPLLKGIKTKEPGVMMAALKVFKQVGKVADSDFLAMEALPILWSFSLGPLLDLQQFQAFMSLIKSLSSRIEVEQTRKLQELSASNGSTSLRTRTATPTTSSSNLNGGDVDFESLVTGRKGNSGTPDMLNDWNASATIRPAAPKTQVAQPPQTAPAFSWSTTNQAATPISQPSISTLKAQQPSTRSITPDQSMNAFASLTPASPFNAPLQPSQPLQPSRSTMASPPAAKPSLPNVGSSINWSAATTQNSSPWAAKQPPPSGSNMSAFSIPPPPMSPPIQSPAYGSMRPPQSRQTSLQAPPAKQGMDKYESLL